MFIIRLTLTVADQKIVAYYKGSAANYQAYSPKDAWTFTRKEAEETIEFLSGDIVSRFHPNVGFVAEIIPAP